MTASTVSRAGIATEAQPAFKGPILNGAVWSVEVATTSLDEANDTVNMGYLPAGVTLLGFIAFADDLDSNVSPALVSKITVGSTDVKTGMTLGQAATGLTSSISSFVAIEPLAITEETLVKWTVTTAAGTAAAGTLVLTPVYLGG